LNTFEMLGILNESRNAEMLNAEIMAEAISEQPRAGPAGPIAAITAGSCS
jgi:hypothetical protein